MPEKANGFGTTLELVDAESDNGQPENWIAELDMGTPGKVNSGTVEGIHSFNWQPEERTPDGVYLIRLMTESSFEIRRIIYTK